MNVVKMQDGLGNQLHQYAFGRSLEMMGSEIGYDISWYDTYKNELYPRPFVLDKFVDIKIQPLLGQRKLSPSTYRDFVKIDNIDFYGYWFSKKYFERAIPVLKKEIIVKHEYHTQEFLDLKKRIVNTKSVSIHIRRGDAIKDGEEFPIGYYFKAIEYLKKRRKIGDIFIFSDDIPWCRENFNDVTFVDLIDYLAFELLRFCRYNIFIFSSFARWGAYLNDNSDRMIIIPKIDSLLNSNQIPETNIIERRKRLFKYRSEMRKVRMMYLNLAFPNWVTI